MDAGDYNKYVTFAESVIHQMLNAWEEKPEAFGDDYNIPESGNNVPDIIDEIHFEMQWMSRMQEQDGGVLQKMGEINYNGTTPPSSDTRPRYYVPSCSSSTIAAAGMYAHAALVFHQFDQLREFAIQLENQALLAWQWYHDNPKSTNCDEQIVKSGDADRSLKDQKISALIAATYLHRLTRSSQFGEYVESNYTDPEIDLFGWSGNWAYKIMLAESLLHYAESGLGSVAFVQAVHQKKLQNENGTFVSWSDQDLYRGYMPDSQYHWGSHNIRCNMANASYEYITFGFEEADLAERRLRAENMLHYILGVNPLGLVYLSRMEDYGAESSVQEFYHSWFKHGSIWDRNPPPGYLPGGPNASYTGNLPELQDVPVQKSYAEFNGGASNSWEITENAIYYQAAFVKMLSKFVSQQGDVIDREDPDKDGIANSMEDWLGLDSGKSDSIAEHVYIENIAADSRFVFPRKAMANPGLVRIESSTDLSAWKPYPVDKAELIGESDNTTTWAIPLQQQTDEELYIRLRMNGTTVQVQN